MKFFPFFMKIHFSLLFWIFFADVSKNLRARYIKNRSSVLADFLTYDRHHAYNLIEPLDRLLKQFSLISSIKGAPPPKNEKKSLFQFLLNLKLENICELMQKTASPYLFPFQNYGRMKLTCTDILLYKNGHFLRQIRV